MYKQMIPAELLARNRRDQRSGAHSNAPAHDSTQAAPPCCSDELTALKGKYLRLAADFENYRRRTTAELEQRAMANVSQTRPDAPSTVPPFRISIHARLQGRPRIIFRAQPRSANVWRGLRRRIKKGGC